ncbi:hypothetical protein VP758_005203 [Vibrio harveyi]|nr:hypothetical protein [Vibrio harveyi]
MVKLRLSNVFFAFLLGILACRANALSIEGEFSNGEVRWYSAEQSGSNSIKPMYAEITQNLAPASKWTPGNPGNTGVLTLRSGNVSLPNISYQITGLEFFTGNKFPTLSDDSGSASVTKSGTILKISGSGLGNKAVSTDAGKMFTPFTQFTPIIQINSTQLNDAFSKGVAGSFAPRGIYSGIISTHLYYDYYANGIRQRAHVPYQIHVRIDHKGATITEATLTSPTSGVIQAFYTQDKVSGTTRYNGVVKGALHNGVYLSLASSNDYALKKSAGNSASIKLDITCDGCADSVLVEKGIVKMNKSKGTLVSGGSGSQLNFGLNIGFKDQDMAALENGNYQGLLTFYVEPKL